MTLVRRKTYGDGVTEAVVTLVPCGVNGFHVHTSLLDLGRRRNGLCGTVSTEIDAERLFGIAKAKAAKWADRRVED